MPRGFLTTYGSANTDQIVTGLKRTGIQHSIHVRAFRATSAAGNAFMVSTLNGGWCFYCPTLNSTNCRYYTEEWSGGAVFWDNSTALLTGNVWGSAGVSYDASSTSNSPKMYSNGKNVTVSAASPSGTFTASATNSFLIGQRNLGASNSWDGMLGEVAFWSCILSEQEFCALHFGTNPLTIRPGSLEGYWPLDGYDHPAIDLSANKRHGYSITGTKWQPGRGPSIVNPVRSKLDLLPKINGGILIGPPLPPIIITYQRRVNINLTGP